MIAVRSVVALVLAGLMAGGCGAHRLSRAQDAFSRAAEQENRLVALTPVASLAYGSPVSLYLEADRILTKDTQGRASELKTDGLLATAYALHAMTLWRLTDLSTLVPVTELEAAQQAKASKDERKDPRGAQDVTDASVKYRQRGRDARVKALAEDLKAQLGPRDRVMMDVLPGLMDHDTGLQHLVKREWQRAHQFFGSAFDEIDKALERAPPNHDIRAYLWMVQVQSLVAWRNAVENGPLPPSAKDACRNEWFIPRLKLAITSLQALAKQAGVHPKEDIWSSDFVRSRLNASGLTFSDVKDDKTTPKRCQWN